MTAATSFAVRSKEPPRINSPRRGWHGWRTTMMADVIAHDDPRVGPRVEVVVGVGLGIAEVLPLQHRQRLVAIAADDSGDAEHAGLGVPEHDRAAGETGIVLPVEIEHGGLRVPRIQRREDAALQERDLAEARRGAATEPKVLRP